MSNLLAKVPLVPPDPIFHLTASYEKDPFPGKVNVGVGAYRTDEGKPWVLPVVKKAEQAIVQNETLNHEYLPIQGLESFGEASAKLIFGGDSTAILEKRYVSVQTISGTGACRLGADFLSRFTETKTATTVFIPNPTWANHKTIFQDAGMKVAEYPYYHAPTRGLDLDNMLKTIKAAPEGSVILLHACAHNPTGVDPTLEQWQKIAQVIHERKHFTFFDCAYQGFASGSLDKDAAAVRLFVSLGMELFVAQSYSKNFGIYNERCGSLSVACKSAEAAAAVKSQLNKLTRAIISNPPAFGARIVSHVLNDAKLYEEWVASLKEMSGRIQLMRKKLYDRLIELGTPGTWNHILDQIGMFTFTGLEPNQCQTLIEKFHIYLTSNGRISMPGLNTNNIEYFATSIDWVVRNVK